MGYIVVGGVVELGGARAFGPRPSDPQYPAAWSFSHALRRYDDTGFARPDRPASDRAAGCPARRAARAAPAASTGSGGVAGWAARREPAAGSGRRRSLPTNAGWVVCGRGSKPLL